jgi:hypothetical protein
MMNKKEIKMSSSVLYMNWKNNTDLSAADIVSAQKIFPALEKFDVALDLIPPHMHGAIYRWLLKGIYPGDFLGSVLSNDLRGALSRADPENKAAISHWVELFCYMPSGSFGNNEQMKTWQQKRGLLGIDKLMRSEYALHNNTTFHSIS